MCKASAKRLVELGNEVAELSAKLVNDLGNEDLQREIVRLSNLMSKIAQNEIVTYEVEQPCQLRQLVDYSTPTTSAIRTKSFEELKAEGYYFAEYYRYDGLSRSDGSFTGWYGYKDASNEHCQRIPSPMLELDDGIYADTNWHASQTVAFKDKSQHEEFLRRNGPKKY